MKHKGEGRWHVEWILTDKDGNELVIKREIASVKPYGSLLGPPRPEQQIAEFHIAQPFDKRWVSLHARGTLVYTHTSSSDPKCYDLTPGTTYRTVWQVDLGQ